MLRPPFPSSGVCHHPGVLDAGRCLELEALRVKGMGFLYVGALDEYQAPASVDVSTMRMMNELCHGHEPSSGVSELRTFLLECLRLQTCSSQ